MDNKCQTVYQGNQAKKRINKFNKFFQSKANNKFFLQVMNHHIKNFKFTMIVKANLLKEDVAMKMSKSINFYKDTNLAHSNKY